MDNTPRFLHSLPAAGLGLILCAGGVRPTLAEPPSAVTTGETVPQGSFLSSLKQAFKQDFDHQVVRGHFDVGSAPDAVHRYYCLVDAKTGIRQANGVAGQPFARADGMTGINGTAVSLYSCASTEKEGLLVTTGYVLTGGAAAEAATPKPVTPAASPAVTGGPVVVPDSSSYRVDVAGVTLGMSVDEVRTILRSKKLLDYHESMQTLGHLEPAAGTAAASGANFVNTVAAWTPPVDGNGESYEVMFTPVPGRERAMAIIHSVGYSPALAIRESALTGGLIKKYGGFTDLERFPAAPTWRVQQAGGVQVGDSCQRRGVFGGLAEGSTAATLRPNLALKTTPDEFRYQIDLCGVAIVTEDHVVGSAAPHEERHVTRFTVTAYSPAVGFEGAAAAAQWMLAGPVVRPARSADAPPPNL